MYYFNRLSPNNFALLAAFLGVLLNSALNLEQQNSLGNFFASLGQTMMTAAAQAESSGTVVGTDQISQQIDDMGKQLEQLKKQIGRY